MVCVHCGGKTRVSNSRAQKRLNQVWRRRVCTSCEAVFSTEEGVDYRGSWVVQGKSGAVQPFSRDKLFLSLHNSCQHRKTALKDAAGLTDTVINKLLTQIKDGTIYSSAISQTAQVALNRFDKAASTHYQAFHT